MSQAKKVLHSLTCKLVLKTVGLLLIFMLNLMLAINISITCLLIQITPNNLQTLARLCALVGCALLIKTLYSLKLI